MPPTMQQFLAQRIRGVAGENKHIFESKSTWCCIRERCNEVGTEAKADAFRTVRSWPDLGDPNNGRSVNTLVCDNKHQEKKQASRKAATVISTKISVLKKRFS